MKIILSVIFFQREHGQIAAESTLSRFLLKYAYDVTWLTHRSQGNISVHTNDCNGEARGKDLCGRYHKGQKGGIRQELGLPG